MLPTLSLIVLVIVTSESIFESELAWLSSLFSIASVYLRKKGMITKQYPFINLYHLCYSDFTFGFLLSLSNTLFKISDVTVKSSLLTNYRIYVSLVFHK